MALLTSLALALTWTPTLSQYLVHKGESAAAPDSNLSEKDRLLAAEEAALSGRFRRVVDFYERSLRFALERPRWIALFAGGLVIISFFCYRALGTDLLPEMDEGGFILTTSRRREPRSQRRTAWSAISKS